MSEILKDKIFIIHDVEIFKNFFCIVLKFDGRYLVYEISKRKDQQHELMVFLRKAEKAGWFLVGFNSVRFDGQLLQWILDKGPTILNGMSGDKKAKEIHFFAQEVINKSKLKQFLPYAEYQLSNRHIDLFLQNHYNNVARSTSLKWLEYSMNWHRVQDLPHKHDVELKDEDFDPVIEYCKNDVDATDMFFGKCTELLELRFAQHEANPKLGLLNKSDSSVGEALFLDLMSKKLNINKKELKQKQTYHSQIELKDVILPYVNFKTDTFKGVLEYFKKAVVKDEDKQRSFRHVVEYDGIEYIYGVGGLHASLSNQIVLEDDDHILLDLDVASYYPNLSIRNGFYPKHLSKQFCELYESLYNKRKSIPKSNPQNKSLKLLLNSIYGKSGDAYSFVFDKFFQMCITVNGQLLLTMLAERMSFIQGVTVFYANTDGITMKVHKSKKQEVYNVWKWWEKLTKLELEHAVYKKMILRDVNNYIALTDSDKVKTKGAFDIDVEYHKNRSQRIVPIAVKRYFIHDVPVEETISQHLIHERNYGDPEKGGIENQGIYDFCIGKKIKGNQKYSMEQKVKDRIVPEHETKDEKRDFLLKYDWQEEEQNKWRKKDSEDKFRGFTDAYRTLILQEFPEYEKVETIDDKVLRFYVSEDGHYLNKNYSDGRIEVSVGGNKVLKFMDYRKEKDYKVNYQYYIDEAYKLIHEVDGTNDRLAEEERIRKQEEKTRKEEEKKLKLFQKKESMYLKYCINNPKGPTKKQLEKYGSTEMYELHGYPLKVR